MFTECSQLPHGYTSTFAKLWDQYRKMGGGGGAAMLVYTSRKHVNSLNPLQLKVGQTSVKGRISTSLKGKSLGTWLANIYTHVTQYTCKCTCSCICVIHVHVLYIHIYALYM